MRRWKTFFRRFSTEIVLIGHDEEGRFPLEQNRKDIFIAVSCYRGKKRWKTPKKPVFLRFFEGSRIVEYGGDFPQVFAGKEFYRVFPPHVENYVEIVQNFI